MSTARRRHVCLKKKHQRNNSHFLKIIVPLLFISFLLVLLIFKPKIWSGKELTTVAVNKSESDISLLIFDPVEGEITNIIIPTITQVSVAGELGSWKLGSVWQLGLNEKMGGSLLSRTITKNFSFPTVAWADSQAYGFFEGGAISLLKATFAIYKTNLTLGDRVRMALFTLRVQKSARDSFNIKDAGFLKKTKLVGGEEGYTVFGQIPEKLSAYFNIRNVSEKDLVARITDATERANISERVGKVIEVMGIKVGAITKEEGRDTTCVVMGKNKQLVKRLSLVFDCSVIVVNDDIGNFDIDIVLGKKFVEKF